MLFWVPLRFMRHGITSDDDGHMTCPIRPILYLCVSRLWPVLRRRRHRRRCRLLHIRLDLPTRPVLYIHML